MSVLTFPGVGATSPMAAPGIGEEPMAGAPSVELDNGAVCIPQHYLRFRHTPASLAEVVGRIGIGDGMLLFAGSDGAGMYVQVGMIGPDNYDHADAPRPAKLVYGRRWRIEPYLPTSEIVQTVFLAVQKACEHEVREWLTLQEPVSGRTSAPLSSHQDLPMMARNRALLAPEPADAPWSGNDVEAWLAPLRVGDRRVGLRGVCVREDGSAVIDVRLGTAPRSRRHEGLAAHYDGWQFSVVLETLGPGELVYEIMDALIRRSNRRVEEAFSYDGFARFSRGNDPARIARLSVTSRPYARDRANAAFAHTFAQTNYEVDALRAPPMGDGALAERNRTVLDRWPGLLGHLPAGYQGRAAGPRLSAATV